MGNLINIAHCTRKKSYTELKVHLTTSKLITMIALNVALNRGHGSLHPLVRKVLSAVGIELVFCEQNNFFLLRMRRPWQRKCSGGFELF